MSRMKRLKVWCEQCDGAVISFLHRHSLSILRVSLGIVFLWFGALKVTGTTPVADLVAQTLYWMPIPAAQAVIFIGWWEVLIGLGLLIGRWLRITLVLMFLQQLGTFLVLVLLPQVAFQHGNPLLLTVVGEFVVKNIVLVSAGLVVGASVHVRRVRARQGVTRI